MWTFLWNYFCNWFYIYVFGMVRLIEKRYSHDAIVIVDHLKEDLIYIDGKDELLELAEYVDILQEENQRLEKAEILANHRGEMIGFATVLIEELGSKEMRKMWNDFRIMKYKEWRGLD